MHHATYSLSRAIGSAPEIVFEAFQDFHPKKGRTDYDSIEGKRLVYSYAVKGEGILLSASLVAIVIEKDGAGSIVTITENAALAEGADSPEDRRRKAMERMERIVASIKK